MGPCGVGRQGHATVGGDPRAQSRRKFVSWEEGESVARVAPSQVGEKEKDWGATGGERGTSATPVVVSFLQKIQKSTRMGSSRIQGSGRTGTGRFYSAILQSALFELFHEKLKQEYPNPQRTAGEWVRSAGPRVGAHAPSAPPAARHPPGPTWGHTVPLGCPLSLPDPGSPSQLIPGGGFAFACRVRGLATDLHPKEQRHGLTPWELFPACNT